MLKDNEIITDLTLPEEIDIKSMIYTIRGQQVILDSDLAKLYQVETKNLNKAIKRNQDRFPERYYFQLTTEEYENLRFQSGTSSSNENNGYGGRRYLPYVFTEHGALAASYVLKSKIASEMSIKITDEFVAMRKLIATNMYVLPPSVYQDIKSLKEGQSELYNTLNQVIEYISDTEIDNQKIYFDSQTYDAFSFIATLIESANKSIVLIDGYTDIKTLNLLAKKKTGVNVTMYSFLKHKPTEIDISTFNSQYPNLEAKTMHSCHDRYLILDDKFVYMIGSSIKDAGKKSFSITKFEDINSIHTLIKKLDTENIT